MASGAVIEAAGGERRTVQLDDRRCHFIAIDDMGQPLSALSGSSQSA